MALGQVKEKLIPVPKVSGNQAGAQSVDQRPEGKQQDQPQYMSFQKAAQIQGLPVQKQRPGEHEEHRHPAPHHGADQAQGHKGRGIQGADVVQGRAGMDQEDHDAGRQAAQVQFSSSHGFVFPFLR